MPTTDTISSMHARSVVLVGNLSRLLDNLPEDLALEREQMEAELSSLIDLEAAFFAQLPAAA